MTDPQQNGARPARPADRDPGSLHLATVAGIPIRLHFTFLVLLAFLGLFSSGRGAGGTALSLAFVVAIFACVVLHELGHSLVARHYGIRVESITLYPIGGIARIVERPKPAQELWIAVAGPIVNIAIALVLIGFVYARGEQLASAPAFLRNLVGANITLAVFNLIPAFPMDGGRILRAALAVGGVPYVAATRWSAGIGQALAIAACLYATFAHAWLLMFVAFFVYLGAGQEALAAQQEAVFTDLPITHVMETDLHTLSPGSTLKEAADALLATSQHDFPVVNGDDVIGLLTRERLLHALATEGPDAYVAGVMDREFSRAAQNEEVGTLIAEIGMAAPARRRLPLLVFRDGRMVGMVTGENLTEYFAIQRVLGPDRR